MQVQEQHGKHSSFLSLTVMFMTLIFSYEVKEAEGNMCVG